MLVLLLLDHWCCFITFDISWDSALFLFTEKELMYNTRKAFEVSICLVIFALGTRYVNLPLG
jgi:hypothetical protein